MIANMKCFNFLDDQAAMTKTTLFEDGVFTLGPELVNPRLLMSAVQISGTQVLVFNGYNIGVHDDANIYDFQTGQWTDVGPSPAPTYNSASVLIKDAQGEDLVFIIGTMTLI